MSCKGGNIKFPPGIGIPGNVQTCGALKIKNDCNTAASVLDSICGVGGKIGGKDVCNKTPLCKWDDGVCKVDDNCHWSSSSNILVIILIIIGSLLAAIIIGYVIMKFYKKRKTTAGGYYNY